MVRIDDLVASRMGERADPLDVWTAYQTLTLEEINDCLVWENSYTRLPALLEIKGLVDDALWFAALGESWENCDNIGHYFDEITDALFSDMDRKDIQRLMMTPDERKAFDKLPDEFVVYRGCCPRNKWGLSWSMSVDIASKFPALDRYRGEGGALLVKAKAEKKNIFALKMGRNEAEIITYRPKHISTRKLRVAVAA